MKKLILLPLLAFVCITFSCSKGGSYDQQKSTELVSKIQNGTTLDQTDYALMIELSEGGLTMFENRLDSANVTTRAAYDSVMNIPPANPGFSAMLNDCLLYERMLKDAPLDDNNKKAYNDLIKRKKAFNKKYKAE